MRMTYFNEMIIDYAQYPFVRLLYYNLKFVIPNFATLLAKKLK